MTAQLACCSLSESLPLAHCGAPVLSCSLLLTRDGPGAEIKIIDFGLSKILPEADTSTTHSFLGTRGYLAPEMLQREAYSASVDVWALGVIAFILLCGCLPFDDDSAKISAEMSRSKFQLRFPQWAQGISSEVKLASRKACLEESSSLLLSRIRSAAIPTCAILRALFHAATMRRPRRSSRASSTRTPRSGPRRARRWSTPGCSSRLTPRQKAPSSRSS